MSTTLILTPSEDRGVAILDALEADSVAAFCCHMDTGARSYWVNAAGAPQDGYPAALARLDPDWTRHMACA